MPQATILIVTRNRKETARTAVASAFSQLGDNQVLVVDDGSSDGTAEYLQQLFQAAKVVSYPAQEGYIRRRNQGGEIAAAPILFSIDDDAVFADPNVVEDTLKIFGDPAVAVVMIPHVNHSPEDVAEWYAPVAPADGQLYVTNTFIGTAYALRKDLFNSLGGFQSSLFHWGEEAEFSQRLLNSGHIVVMGTQHRIRHYPAGLGKYNRDNIRYIYRNRILTVWYNAPLILLAPLLLLQSASAVLKAPRTQWVSIEGTLVGLGHIFRQWSLRKPLRMQAYRLWFWLRKKKMMPLSEIRDRIPSTV